MAGLFVSYLACCRLFLSLLDFLCAFLAVFVSLGCFVLVCFARIFVCLFSLLSTDEVILRVLNLVFMSGNRRVGKVRDQKT